MEEQRLSYAKAAPESYRTMKAFSDYTKTSPLEPALRELVKIRASQINGCAYCLDMHTKDARAAGETEERIHLLNAWRESALYNDRERAALAWTEALTLLPESHAPQELYQEVRRLFSEKETVDLTHVIVVINAWNRFMVAFRVPPGHYQPAAKGFELRPICENCAKLLPPDSLEAMICSFECTFCRECVEVVLENVCPNCGGGFVPRPIRPVTNWRNDNDLDHYPAATRPKHRPVNREDHLEFARKIKVLPPEKR